MNDIKITLLAVISKDGFITDENGDGNFSSIEDKTEFRSYLRSDKCDCFICGRKTGEEFKERLNYKPLFILTRKPLPQQKNIHYIKNLNELFTTLKEKNLSKPALLGGAEAYNLFIENNLVNKAIITQENNIISQKGIKFDIDKIENTFQKSNVKILSSNTIQHTYVNNETNSNNLEKFRFKSKQNKEM